MTRDDMEIVSALRGALAGKVGKARYDLWFGSSTQLAIGEGALRIGVPNRFFQDWIRANFRGEIESACREVLDRPLSVEFVVDSALGDARSQQAAPANTAETALPAPTSHARQTRLCFAEGESSTVLATSRIASSSVLRTSSVSENGTARRRPLLGLSSFVVGPSNRLAFASAEMVAREPGRITPLVIHGPTGVGKTHLLQAICGEVRKIHPDCRAISLSAEQFTSGFVEAVQGRGMPAFRRKYRGVDVLLLDDLEVLAGKRVTLVEMVHTIDELLREGRQLVFTADRPPAEMSGLGPDLVARLTGGMVCAVESPDYQTRLGIVAAMCRRVGLTLPEDVQQYIASQLTGHARELSGALCCLQATSRASGRPIDLDSARESLATIIRANSRPVALADIEKALCEEFGISATDLQSDTKAKSMSHPRMLAMWLARKHTRAALSEIGRYFGRRSHSTVVSAQKRIDGWVNSGRPICLAEHTWKLDEAIRRVERRLQAG